MKLSHSRSRSRGLTMVELLVVIAILGILSAMLLAGLGKAKIVAEAAKNTANLREIAQTTILWAADNSGKLPSPEYPGGMDPDSELPEHWDLGESGLWIDGVVFAAVYMRENKEGQVTQYDVDEKGSHLKGTLFESTQSVAKDPTEEDWHKHSYAMNANLKYDRIYDQIDSDDPWLTEKTLLNLPFGPNAMLYIENQDSNVVMAEDRDDIVETFEYRWGKKGIAAFLDGHADRIAESQIPEGDIETDREASRFWRGVEAER